MDKNINPPAAVKANVDLKALAGEVKVIFKAADNHRKRGLRAYKDAGDRLRKMKKAAGHGNWLSVLQFHGIPQQRASECIRVSLNWEKIKACDGVTAALGEADVSEDEPPTSTENQIAGTGNLASKPGHAPTGSQERCIGGDADPPKPRPPKPGRVIVDWKGWDASFTKVANTPNAIAKALPGESESADYEKAMRLLNELADVMKAWKARLK